MITWLKLQFNTIFRVVTYFSFRCIWTCKVKENAFSSQKEHEQSFAMHHNLYLRLIHFYQICVFQSCSEISLNITTNTYPGKRDLFLKFNLFFNFPHSFYWLGIIYILKGFFYYSVCFPLNFEDEKREKTLLKD